jgi:hypothetical protein
MPGEIQPHDLGVSSEVRKLIIPEAAVATPAMAQTRERGS